MGRSALISLSTTPDERQWPHPIRTNVWPDAQADRERRF
jgi:hypothetical protein